MNLNESSDNQIEASSAEFAIVAVSTYLFLTKNGLKSDYVLELLHESIDEIVNIVKSFEKNGGKIYDD
jgi:hypothetical protein|tara:strand:+ start:85 stop:288 length:204 start_codon:yes stop_codon:yes gene_type:complete